MCWMIEDTGNRNGVFAIAFETKAAADLYVQKMGNPKWRVFNTTLASLDLVKGLGE